MCVSNAPTGSAWGWCHGESNCPDLNAVEPIDQLQAEVDDLEQDIVNLNNDVAAMREAFRQVTQIMSAEFNN